MTSEDRQDLRLTVELWLPPAIREELSTVCNLYGIPRRTWPRVPRLWGHFAPLAALRYVELLTSGPGSVTKAEAFRKASEEFRTPVGTIQDWATSAVSAAYRR